MKQIRYIKVNGDFLSTGLWDEMSYKQIKPQDLGLPEHFVKRLDQLVRDYDKLIPLGTEQLKTPEKRKEIESIDARGTELTRELAQFLGDKYSLRYYSEGLQKFIEI